MGRPAKPLIAHVLEDTFRVARHAQMLREQPLPQECPLDGAGEGAREVWARLRALAVEYREMESPQRRRAIAERFAAAVAEFQAALDAGDVSPGLKMYAALGPPMMRPGIAEAFEEWEASHGLAWRVIHGCPTRTDEWLLEHGRTVDPDAAPADPPGYGELSAA